MSDSDRVTVSLRIGGTPSAESEANKHLWERRPVPPHLMGDQPRTIDEWRITGNPGHGYPPYWFTFYGDVYEDPEASARKFCELARDWADGPHLSHRTVTYTAWMSH